MNEEIRNNETKNNMAELNGEQLEGVAGGSGFAGICPRCLGRCIKSVSS